MFSQISPQTHSISFQLSNSLIGASHLYCVIMSISIQHHFVHYLKVHCINEINLMQIGYIYLTYDMVVMALCVCQDLYSICHNGIFAVSKPYWRCCGIRLLEMTKKESYLVGNDQRSTQIFIEGTALKQLIS